MPLYFIIIGQRPNGLLPITSFSLAADRLSCALPRVPHLCNERLWGGMGGWVDGWAYYFFLLQYINFPCTSYDIEIDCAD
jgi:hypothetical protein